MDNSLLMLVDRPIAFHRCFAEIGGSANAGLFLSQAVYWSFRTDDPEGWFWKTREEWKEETYLSRTEQETVRRALKKAGFLEEKVEGLPARLYFRINLKNVTTALESIGGRKPANKAVENLPTGQREIRPLVGWKPAVISETTSETTPETNRESRPVSLSGPPLKAPPVQAGAAPETPSEVAQDPAEGAPRPVEQQTLSTELRPDRPTCQAAGPARRAPEFQPERAGEITPAPPDESSTPANREGAPAAGGILAELEAMAAGITAAATHEIQRPVVGDELRPAAPDSYLAENFSANDPVRVLADEYTRLLLAEFDAGYDTFRRRGLDLEASRTGLQSAVVEQPEKYRKIRDRRLYVRKWLLNERARRPV